MDNFKIDCGTTDGVIQVLQVMDTMGLKWETGQKPSERVPDHARFLYVESGEIGFDRDTVADARFFRQYDLAEISFDDFMEAYGTPQIKYQFDTEEFEAMLGGASYGGEYN